MEATQKKIGAQIAALQRAKGLTQEQLAEMLGVSAPAVSKWETDSSYPDITCSAPWPGPWAPIWILCCSLRKICWTKR